MVDGLAVQRIEPPAARDANPPSTTICSNNNNNNNNNHLFQTIHIHTCIQYVHRVILFIIMVLKY